MTFLSVWLRGWDVSIPFPVKSSCALIPLELFNILESELIHYANIMSITALKSVRPYFVLFCVIDRLACLVVEPSVQ